MIFEIAWHMNNTTLKLKTKLAAPAFSRGARVTKPSAPEISKFEFWFVWAINTESTPRRRHKSEADAQRERIRLAAIVGPTKDFRVFHAREVTS